MIDVEIADVEEGLVVQVVVVVLGQLAVDVEEEYAPAPFSFQMVDIESTDSEHGMVAQVAINQVNFRVIGGWVVVHVVATIQGC